jgi:hypothetical protein
MFEINNFYWWGSDRPLGYTSVYRGGATSGYLNQNTQQRVLFSGDRPSWQNPERGLSMRYQMASKGGGVTVLEFKIGRKAFPRILREMINADRENTLKAMQAEIERQRNIAEKKDKDRLVEDTKKAMLADFAQETLKLEHKMQKQFERERVGHDKKIERERREADRNWKEVMNILEILCARNNVARTRKALEKYGSKLEDKWLNTPAGSESERLVERWRNPVKEILDDWDVSD